MTTAVTVTTHDRPVDVTTTQQYPADRSLYTQTVTVETNGSRDFYLSDGVTITFEEASLPQPTVS